MYVERLVNRIKNIIEDIDSYKNYWRTNNIIYTFYDEMYPRLYAAAYLEINQKDLQLRVEKKFKSLKTTITKLQETIKMIQNRSDQARKIEEKNLDKKRLFIDKRKTEIFLNPKLLLSGPYAPIRRISYGKGVNKNYQITFNMLKESLDANSSFDPEIFMQNDEDYRNDVNYIIYRFKNNDIDIGTRAYLMRALNNLISYYGRGGLVCLPPTKNTLNMIKRMKNDNPFLLIVLFAVFGPILREMLTINKCAEFIDECEKD